MASNVADSVIFFPAWHDNAGAVPAVLDWDVAVTADAELGVYPITSRCQVKQFGFIVTVQFAATAGVFSTDPVLLLKSLGIPGTDISTATTLVTFPMGTTNTKLSFPTLNLTAVAAGGPGVVVTGPGLGGNRTLVTALTQIAPGCILLAPDASLPTAMLQPGQFLSVNLTGSAGAGEAGAGIAFVRLEYPGGENTELVTVAQSGVTAGT
jgi:hypothetical protein